MSTLQKMGRPPGKLFPAVKQIRLGTQDAAFLALLSRAWECTEAEAMRRAIRLATEQDTDARFRAAAERLAEYYRTNPEVQEWLEADLGETEYLGEPALTHVRVADEAGSNGAAPADDTVAHPAAIGSPPHL
jgi:hypothetical protein